MNRRTIWVTLILMMSNAGIAQVEFDEYLFYEHFFCNVQFEQIPYFNIGSPQPEISIDQARDTIIEVFDIFPPYDSKFVNQRSFIQEGWSKFYESEKYIENRDLQLKSYHLVNTNIEFRELSEIMDIVSIYFSELIIDSTEIFIKRFNTQSDSIITICNQNFLFNIPMNCLSKQQEYDLRGIFRFGSVFLTSDRNYAITTFDVYHKWIDSNGEETEILTGSTGIIIINLMNEQKIECIKQLSEY